MAVLIAMGVIAGLFLVHACKTVEISPRAIVLLEGSRRLRFARKQVATVEQEGKRLSLRDVDDADLAREKLDVDPEALRRALAHHGWTDGRERES